MFPLMAEHATVTRSVTCFLKASAVSFKRSSPCKGQSNADAELSLLRLADVMSNSWNDTGMAGCATDTLH